MSGSSTGFCTKCNSSITVLQKVHDSTYHQHQVQITFKDSQFELVSRSEVDNLFHCPCGNYQSHDPSGIRKHSKIHSKPIATDGKYLPYLSIIVLILTQDYYSCLQYKSGSVTERLSIITEIMNTENLVLVSNIGSGNLADPGPNSQSLGTTVYIPIRTIHTT